ncbi:hypothetical protein AVEN_104787-1 [Araneus ventricosus]|uniref:THAP-type domain-containing protein n=1 Tax=Araneus ventricosus TaxID=182803 RepID=A0A4Y2TX56_ARAVE|nr:hypothetical protein AVEN_104787-1 [Araneus ventricosus]
MPNTCCVTNCRGNYDAGNKVAVFSFPKVQKLKWIQAIPRRDLVVTKNTTVCEKHFTDDDMERVTTFYKESTGETLIAKLKKPRLKEGATPEIFPHCPSYLSSTKVARDGPEDVVHIVLVSHTVAEDLFPLIKKIILALEEIGFKVMGIVTDNNSINRKAVSSFNNPPQFQVQYQHPADEKMPLFYLIDLVHLIKCMRNNWINKINGYFMHYPQFEGEENAVQITSVSILRKIYDIESSELLKFGIGLRKALWPTNLERQNVSRALKIFSSNLVKGLLELGEKHNLMLYGDTVNFLNIFCTWWDIANVKTVTKVKHKNNPMAEPITDSLNDIKKDFLKSS